MRFHRFSLSLIVTLSFLIQTCILPAHSVVAIVGSNGAVEITDALLDESFDVGIALLETNKVDSFKIRFADEQKIISARTDDADPTLKVVIDNPDSQLLVLLNAELSALSALNLKASSIRKVGSRETHTFKLKELPKKAFKSGAINLFVFVPQAALRTGLLNFTASLKTPSTESGDKDLGITGAVGKIVTSSFLGIPIESLVLTEASLGQTIKVPADTVQDFDVFTVSFTSEDEEIIIAARNDESADADGEDPVRLEVTGNNQSTSEEMRVSMTRDNGDGSSSVQITSLQSKDGDDETFWFRIKNIGDQFFELGNIALSVFVPDADNRTEDLILVANTKGSIFSTETGSGTGSSSSTSSTNVKNNLDELIVREQAAKDKLANLSEGFAESTDEATVSSAAQLIATAPSELKSLKNSVKKLLKSGDLDKLTAKSIIKNLACAFSNDKKANKGLKKIGRLVAAGVKSGEANTNRISKLIATVNKNLDSSISCNSNSSSAL